ncbi:MAG: NADH-quinone oxidoreductase subunit NuoF [Methylobacter sp.]|nr:NADH-quinone oxidoreductase subunit NuoF [Methylobacter sp.]
MDKPLTKNIRPDRAFATLADYESTGGYQGLRTAITQLQPKEVQQWVKDAGLRGRGGAGFGTGLKWSMVPMETPQTRYMIANADEMEPGTFKDRMLMEQDPHQLIEGLIIAAYAIQAPIAYIFLRGEYHVARQRLEHALLEARFKGYLGEHILNSDFNVNIILHTGAGRYICGEETAMLNALEGKRATPRAKPPFPLVSGLWGKPTVVNNVETLCNVPHILHYGVTWYQGLGRGADKGSKLFGVSGRVNYPGLWELPLGIPIREIFENYAGGMRDGYKLRGFLPGGASTDFLLPEHLDVIMDYEAVAKAGSRLGTGMLIVLDDRTCPVKMVLNLEQFFAQESCGWCTPCRDGLPWTITLLKDIIAGKGRREDLDTLSGLTRMLGPGNTFCALAPGAMEPLQSALKYFRDDFERYIVDKSVLKESV